MPRTVKEGKQTQGVDESIVYSLDVSGQGGSPSSPSVVVKDTSNNNTDVTATVMPAGSASASGDIITLPPLTALTRGHNYRIEVQFVSGSNTLEVYFFVASDT